MKRGRSTIGAVSRLENGVGASFKSSNLLPSAKLTVRKEAFPGEWHFDGKAACPCCNALVDNLIWQVGAEGRWILVCSFKCMLIGVRDAKEHRGHWIFHDLM